MKFTNPNSNWYYGPRFDSTSEKSMKGCFYTFVIVALFSAVALILTGCTTTRYVTVPEVHTEYKVRTDTFIQRDSIHVQDSVTIREKGDTVWVERWRTSWRDRWRDRVVCDTVIKCDSVAVPYPVEKPLTWWQKAKLDFSEWVLGVLIVIILVMVFKYVVLKR